MFRSFVLTLGIILTLTLTATPSSVLGQRLPGNQPRPANQPEPPKAVPRPTDEVVIPEPETITLETKDKVQLVCSYFPPPVDPEAPEAGKSTIPFIVLHDWEGDRRQTYLFGKFLQSQGHAALVPGFRGHDQSVKVTGLEKPIDHEKFSRNQMELLIEDIEACKRFLVKRNNEGQVNIDLLTLVATGKSAPLAAAWAYRDWYKYPPYNQNNVKQGQDVKAIVLFGPRRKFATFDLVKSIKTALFAQAPAGAELPLMVIWSTDDESTARESRAIYGALEKVRPKLEEKQQPATDPGQAEPKNAFKIELEGTQLTGANLIEKQNVRGLWQYVSDTIAARVKHNLESTPWTNRDPEEN